MPKWEDFSLQQFLASHPKMRLSKYGTNLLIIEGEYDVNAQMKGFNAIHETYSLKISFSIGYPRVIPIVIETKDKIPKGSENHTYVNGSFCLGSEIKLKKILSESPSIPDFATKILDPFLYSISYKLKYNKFPNGELAHGEAGLVDDYECMFQVNGKASVLGALAALAKRKRVANKLLCPCQCGERLGKCEFRFSLEKWRGLDKRRWFKEHLTKSFSPIAKKRKNHKNIQI